MRTLKLHGTHLKIVYVTASFKSANYLECPISSNSWGTTFCTVFCAWFSMKEEDKARCYCQDILIGRLVE